MDPVSDLHGARLAGGHVGQVDVGVDLDQRDVDARVGADHGPLELAVVAQLHRDLVGIRHDVVVGEEVPVSGDDEA